MTSHPPPNKPDGTRSVPTTLGDGTRSEPATNDPVAAQIEAEIADHLATAANELQSTGVAPDEARRRVETKFGDAASIGRRCYWIQQGDTIMFRYATIGLLVLLCLALAATTIGSWRSQARMAEQMDALTHELRALAEAKQAAPVPVAADPQPLEITGKVYIGTPDKPAVNHPLTLIDVRDGNTVRQFQADAEGKYRSGPLPAGDYAIVSPARTPQGEQQSGIEVQSAPFTLYSGVAAPAHDVDVAYHFGRLNMNLSRPLPQFEMTRFDLPRQYESRLFIKVLTPRLRPARWTAASVMPSSWPLYISDEARSRAIEDPTSSDGLWFYELLSQEDVAGELEGTLFDASEGRLPPGECRIAAGVILHVPPRESPFGRRGGESGERRESLGVGRAPTPRSTEWHSANLPSYFNTLNKYAPFGPHELQDPWQNWQVESGKGGYQAVHWLRAIENSASYRRGVHPLTGFFEQVRSFESAERVPITAGEKTRLLLDIPDDLESRLQTVFDDSDQEWAKATWSSGHPIYQELQISILGTEPLRVDEAE